MIGILRIKKKDDLQKRNEELELENLKLKERISKNQEIINSVNKYYKKKIWNLTNGQNLTH